MEKTPIAITSNGRTVYELAHMSIPGIVIPVNEREKTHEFACERNGFIPLNGFKETKTPKEVLGALKNIVENYPSYFLKGRATYRYLYGTHEGYKTTKFQLQTPSLSASTRHAPYRVLGQSKSNCRILGTIL